MPSSLLQGETTPEIRLPAREDVRIISRHEPGEGSRTFRPGFRHPAGHTRILELFFQDLPLSMAAELLNELSGINLMLQEDISDKRVRLYLQDVDVAASVDSLLRKNGLWFRTDGLTTAVMSEEAFAENMIFQQSEKILAFFMRYTNAQDMAALLATLLEPDVDFRDMSGQSVYGHLEAGSSGASSASGDTRANLTENERKQLIRMGVPDTSLSMEEAAGLLGKPIPAIVTVFKKNNAIVVRSSDTTLLQHISGLIRELDTPIRQVLLEVRILRLQLGDSFESFFDLSYGENRKDYSVGAATLTGAGELAAITLASVFSNEHIAARMQVFARENRMKTLSSPFLMTADNASVRFFVGEEVPLRTGVSKETIRGSDVQDLVVFTMDIQRRELGTELDIRSFINADKTITMEMAIAIESPNYGVSNITLINDRTGQPVVFPLDGVDKNEFRSILAVPAGNTVVLGGFIRQENQDYEQKVPFLGDIPLLGYLFKKVERRAVRNETLILVTPHIMAHPDEGGGQVRRFLERSSRSLDAETEGEIP
ncbi:type II/III secretion system protein [Desulfobotulus alkaliphilus]|uniref:Type II/III secretion system protein n=1 Tax=Desulfobotulus alkaliphilus TaxID=622671 RepID=A0A562S6I6_9BACT|nr:type II and III secretion system protein [Desulfobotulus alkaliphilus]TWI76723.1 type II/III secretion system protein [Desulfobotulus alkaliphilus]